MAQKTENFEELEFYQRRKLVSTLGLLDPISAEFIKYYQNDLQKKETTFIEKHGPKPVLKDGPLTDIEANKWNVWHKNYSQEFEGFDNALDNLKCFLSFDYSCIGLECATNQNGPADFYKYYQDKGLEAIRFLLDLEQTESLIANAKDYTGVISGAKKYDSIEAANSEPPEYLFRGHLLLDPKGSFSNDYIHTTPVIEYAKGYSSTINFTQTPFNRLIASHKHYSKPEQGFLSVYKPNDPSSIKYAASFGFESGDTLFPDRGQNWKEYTNNTKGINYSTEALIPSKTPPHKTYFIDYSKDEAKFFDLSSIKSPLVTKTLKKYSGGLEHYAKIYAPILSLNQVVDRFLNNQTGLNKNQKEEIRNSYQNSVEFVLGQVPEDITQIPSQKLQGSSGVDLDYIPFEPLNQLQKKWYFTTNLSGMLSNGQLAQMLEESKKNKDYIKHLAAYSLPDELSDQAQQSFETVIANRLPHKVEQTPEPPPIATQPIIAEPAVIEEPSKDRIYHHQGSVFSTTWVNGDPTNHTTTILGQPVNTTGVAKWLMFTEQATMMLCRGIKTKFSPVFSNKK